MGLMPSDNHMVKNPNVNERARRSQGLGQNLISRAGFGRSGRMVVRQDNAGCIDCKCPPDNLAWVDRRLG